MALQEQVAERLAEASAHPKMVAIFVIEGEKLRLHMATDRFPYAEMPNALALFKADLTKFNKQREEQERQRELAEQARKAAEKAHAAAAPAAEPEEESSDAA
jgi:hypothetical protein